MIDGTVNRGVPSADMDTLTDIVNALLRQARSLECQADAMAPDDYSREFPAEDARLLRRAADIICGSVGAAVKGEVAHVQP